MPSVEALPFLATTQENNPKMCLFYTIGNPTFGIISPPNLLFINVSSLSPHLNRIFFNPHFIWLARITRVDVIARHSGVRLRKAMNHYLDSIVEYQSF